MFLNEGDKENKRRGIEIRTTCGGEKQERKKKKRMNEMKADKGEIILRIKNLEKCYHNIFTINFK